MGEGKMLGLDDVEKNSIMKDNDFAPLQILEKLNEEMKLLGAEKQKIIDSHKNLLFIMNKRIEAKRRNNEKLKLEIEKRKETCVKMAKTVNASIRFEIDNTAPQ